MGRERFRRELIQVGDGSGQGAVGSGFFGHFFENRKKNLLENFGSKKHF